MTEMEQIKKNASSVLTHMSVVCDVASVDSDYNPEEEFHAIVNGPQGYILWGILFVILTVFGTIGNIITIIVLKRDPIISVLNILLIALAVSDSLAPQANALIAICHYFLSPRYNNSITFLKFYDFIKYIIHPLSTMFTMSSSWIVTATSLFRLIAVIYPLKARSIINKRLAYNALIVIYGFGLLSIIPIYLSVFKTSKCTSDGKSEFETIQMKPSMFMVKVYTPAVQVMCFHIPWLTALITWFFLLRSLKKHNKNIGLLTGGNFKSDTKYSSTRNRHNALEENSLVNSPSQSQASAHGIKLQKTSFNKQLPGSQKSFNLKTLSGSQKPRPNTNVYKITLTVVVLCFMNLVSRIFTFTFIFEVIFNHIQTLRQQRFLERFENQQNPSDYFMELKSITQTAKAEFPNFLGYSLLLNNIFLCLNHGCNIFIYTFTNPRFKKNIVILLGRIFCCKKYKAVDKKNRSIAHSSNKNYLSNKKFEASKECADYL